ncbi:MAG: hypothetical protein QOH34_2157 [Mycobacterium sp.]|jgi:hypothetical protein|nr:hypothetical protein [Mycobacterium sp.]
MTRPSPREPLGACMIGDPVYSGIIDAGRASVGEVQRTGSHESLDREPAQSDRPGPPPARRCTPSAPNSPIRRHAGHAVWQSTDVTVHVECPGLRSLTVPVTTPSFTRHDGCRLGISRWPLAGGLSLGGDQRGYHAVALLRELR